MVPQPVVSTTFKRLKREWNEEKAKKELRELIAETGGRNVSKFSKFGYKDVWVGSQRYRYNPDKPLSKPLVKAMFNQTYVSYNVEMTKGERKRHRDRQSKLTYNQESAKQYEVFKSTKKALQVFKELKPAEIGEGLSSLKNSTGSITFSNIKGNNLKGLNQILRAPVVETLSNYIKKHGAIKINLDVDFEVKDLKDDELSLFPTRTRQYEFLTLEDIKVGLVQMVAETKMSFENKDLKRSGLILKKIDHMTLHYAKFVPLKAGSFIELPPCIANSRSCINIKNTDDLCFKYAVLCMVHKVNEQIHPERVSKYKDLLNTTHVSFQGLPFPMPINKIDRFEQLNNNTISINVFDLQDWTEENATRSKKVRPIRLTKIKAETHVNLLYLTDGEHSHYVPIHKFDTLMGVQKSRHQHKAYFCHWCLHGYCTQELLDKHHKVGCHAVEGSCVELPTPGVDDKMSFQKMYHQFKVPFVIYLDFEAMPQKVEVEQEGKTIQLAKHEVVSFCFKVVCSVPGFDFEPVLFRGEGAIAHLYKELKRTKQKIDALLGLNIDIIMSPDDWKDFRRAENCCFCHKRLGTDRVRDHCHLSGAYRGAAHKDCNFHFHYKHMKIPVFCHNMKGYDSHFIIKEAHAFECKRLAVIAGNSEKFIQFSFDNFDFKDSMSFLNGSLDSLVKLNKYDGATRREDWKEKFPYARAALTKYVTSEEDLDKLTEKGVYPYSYMDCLVKFNYFELPEQRDFYNDLSKTHITNEEYARAKDVWRRFNMQSMGEYHDLYLLTDVVLLADIFENFRSMCLDYYQLDPCHYITLPHFAWDAMLKYTNIELDLVTDMDMYNMIEDGKRGGMCQVSTRYAEANNRYMKDYDPTRPSSYIRYDDANNLYGLAMSKALPYAGYEWAEITEEQILRYSEEDEHGYFLDVDLDVPHELHDKFNDYPLAPERVKVKGSDLSPYSQELYKKIYDLKEGKAIPDEAVEKLILNLHDKRNYVLHVAALKFYLEMGLKLRGIHRCVKFKQSRWLKPYIDFNTGKRKEAKSDFEKDFFKLMNNAPYGKTMEDVKNHMDFELVTTDARMKKVVANPTYKRKHEISEHLVGVEKHKTVIKLNKPIAIGVAILDISKVHMYDFFYNVMRKRYNERECRLLYTDTDSLVMHIHTEDVFKDAKELGEYFDFSGYDPQHPNYDKKNAKVLGKFKDEADGKIITKFCGLKPKMYAMQIEDRGKVKDKMTAKGCPKSYMKKHIQFEDYYKTLMDEVTSNVEFNCIRSKNHNIYTLGINKRGLSPYENKRHYLDSVHSLAYGHRSIVS